MSIDNTAPTVIQNGSTVKTIAFPFQQGSYGLPAMASPTGVTFTRITALMNTAPGEKVMSFGYGMNLHEYNFSNLTVIDKMRMSASVTNGIESYIVGVKVKSVIAGKTEYQSGLGTYVVFDVLWTEAGQSYSSQFLYATPDTGV